jgi:hypothetical protein
VGLLRLSGAAEKKSGKDDPPLAANRLLLHLLWADQVASHFTSAPESMDGDAIRARLLPAETSRDWA